MNYGIVAKNIRAELKAYIQKSGLKALVLGMSGGIDSTVCAALARPVCDELGIPLIGRSLTIETNKQDEIDRSIFTGDVLCTDFQYIDLTAMYHAVKIFSQPKNDLLETDTAYKIRMGNIKARLRMIHIYDLAQQHKGMVLSTDNFTELMLSFWTLHGDVGDYGMVQNLWKMEVYELSTWIAENEYGVGAEGNTAIMQCVEATPTDGLGITSSDVEQLGAKNYAEVDAILKEHLECDEQSRMGNPITSDQVGRQKRYDDRMNHPVIKRHISSEFKRHNPYNLSRSVILYRS